MQDADELASVDDGLAEAMASRSPQEPSPGDAAADKPDEDAGPTRDEKGRFAKADAEAEAATKSEGEDRDGGQIPSWRLRELREERDRIAAREAEKDRELEALRRERAQWAAQQRRQWEAEQAPQRPDPLSDPDGYDAWINQTLDQRTRAIEDTFRNQWVNLTFAEEHEKHGEAFDKAMAALEAARDPQVVADIREAVNPGKALMRWYGRHTAIAAIGDGGIDGYNKRLRDQLKKDPEFRKEFMAELDAEARGGGNAERSSPNFTSLPSVNRAAGRAERQTPGALGTTDAEKFASLSAMDGRRR